MQPVIVVPTRQDPQQPGESCPVQRQITPARANDLADEQKAIAARSLKYSEGRSELPQCYFSSWMRLK